MFMWMWHRFYLLFLVTLVSPLAADCNVVCTGHGNSTTSSNHEANMRVFAAILPNMTSFMPSRYADHATGEFPDGINAVSYCHNGTDSSSCRACITLALQEAQTVCPYQKGVEISNNNCSLKLSGIIYLQTVDSLVLDQKEGFSVMRHVSVAIENIMVLVFQAVGFVCLFFLLRQDWHDRKRRSMMHFTAPRCEDKWLITLGHNFQPVAPSLKQKIEKDISTYIKNGCFRQAHDPC